MNRARRKTEDDAGSGCIVGISSPPIASLLIAVIASLRDRPTEGRREGEREGERQRGRDQRGGDEEPKPESICGCRVPVSECHQSHEQISDHRPKGRQAKNQTCR